MGGICCVMDYLRKGEGKRTGGGRVERKTVEREMCRGWIMCRGKG